MLYLCPPSVRSAFRKVQSGLSSVFFQASHMMCSEQDQPYLEKCYNLADTIRCQILHIESGQIEHDVDHDFELVADLLEMAEGHITSYADLMELLAGGHDEAPQNGESYRMAKVHDYAHQFMESYRNLSTSLRYMVNNALSLQKDIILNLIENKVEIIARLHEMSACQAMATPEIK